MIHAYTYTYIYITYTHIGDSNFSATIYKSEICGFQLSDRLPTAFQLAQHCSMPTAGQNGGRETS